MFLQANVVHKVNFDLTTGASRVEGGISLAVQAKTSFDGQDARMGTQDDVPSQ